MDYGQLQQLLLRNGISLFKEDGSFWSFHSVLAEISAKWESISDKDKKEFFNICGFNK